MHFDRFDICEAYNLYATLYGHDAYTTAIFARLRRIKFRAAPRAEFLRGLTENGREILSALVRRRDGDAAARDLLRYI